MNALWGEQGWHVVGWTMIYFLGAGTLVLLLGAVLRFALRRAHPTIRYTASLAIFAVLALLPIGISGWIALQSPNQASQKHERLENSVNPATMEQSAKQSNTADKQALLPDGVASLAAESKHVQHELRGEVSASLLTGAVEYLPWVWIVGTPLTFLLLASGLIGAERLRKASRPLDAGPLVDACETLRAALHVGRRVGVAVCERVATPLLVGIVRPLILLPPAALVGWSQAELEMVLLHELAHVQRWDNLVNLCQRVVESLLFFHPAVWIASRWVRRDREDCCDAVVVAYTAAPQAYAELLLALASTKPHGGLAASAAMAQHPLAGRIRRILNLEDEPMSVSRNSLVAVATGILSLVLTIALVAPRPTDAEEPGANPEASESKTEASRERKRPEKDEASTASTKKEKKSNIDRVIEPGNTMVHFFPHPTTPEEVMKAVQKLNQIGHSVTVRPTDGGTALLIKDNVPLEAESGKTPFPALEEQRAADVAYKLLGVELEKLSDEDLQRVKAKGYQGGLRVTSGEGGGGFGGPLDYGDLLVGLHVWPTESLDQVNKILSRDDINQLSPLKFYVIRKVHSPDGFSGVPGNDGVVTGRTSVNLDAWRELLKHREIHGTATKPYLLQFGDVIRVRAFNTMDEPAVILEDAYSVNTDGTINLGPIYGELLVAGKSLEEARKLIVERLLKKVRRCEVMLNLIEEDSSAFQVEDEKLASTEETPLLYDGKTFDEWKKILQTELKEESRITCLKAIIAFGRVGRGQEVAKTILEVAAGYDWPSHQIPTPGVTKDLFNSMFILPRRIVVPVLMAASTEEKGNVRDFARLVASIMAFDDPELEATFKKAFPDFETWDGKSIRGGGRF